MLVAESGVALVKKVKENSHEWEQLNQNTPLWLRTSEDVTNGECASFYKNKKVVVAAVVASVVVLIVVVMVSVVAVAAK